MICSKCGGEVIWMGPFMALTHTECQKCGAINAQIPEAIDQDLADEYADDGVEWYEEDQS